MSKKKIYDARIGTSTTLSGVGFESPFRFRWIECWDQFWFAPRQGSEMGWIRVGLSLGAAVYALTWILSLDQWIADSGLLSKSQTEFLIGRGVEGTGSEGRVSPLFDIVPSGLAWCYALATSVSCAIVAWGLGGRIAVGIAWVLLLGLVHRVPMLQGAGDFLITGVFGYLLVFPGEPMFAPKANQAIVDSGKSWLCNLAIRLIQCHVLLWFAASLASHLAEPMWWNGTAPWWLAFSGDQSWVSLSFWVDHSYSMNLVCYWILLLHVWVLVSFLVPSWRRSGVVALLLFAITNLVIANDWLYSVTVIACSPILLVPTRQANLLR